MLLNELQKQAREDKELRRENRELQAELAQIHAEQTRAGWLRRAAFLIGADGAG
jgi:hypothetical protein